MRIPFAKLMEMVDEIEDTSTTLGELGDRWNEDPLRIMDAIDANKVVRGEIGYIG